MQTEPTTALDALRDGTTSLGIELGSTRIKAVLVDDEGTPIASGNAAWENELRDGFWTYSLDAVHEGLQRAYASLADDCERQWGARPERIGAIGVSGMMHGYLAFDADGALLVPFRTWRNATTARAAELLTAELGVRMPLRWSASHLLQAVLDDEEHVGRLAAITTLAGYVHRLLGGAPVLGPDDASGMFPLAPSGTEYDAELLAAFDALAARHGAEGLRIADLLPQVRTAGDDAGSLSDAGARLLDATGALRAGAALCPPEGDAGTGMVATGALAPGTGNVSVGTSIFAMIVLDAVPTGEPLDADIVATPGGKPSAMVHCDNGTAELGAWAGLFGQFAAAAGVTLAPDEVFAAMLGGSAGGSVDELVAYTPTASRGTSTPSDTIRTATIQRCVPSEKALIRSEPPGSSDSTTVGSSPEMPRSSAAYWRACAWSVAITRPPASGTVWRTCVSRTSALRSTCWIHSPPGSSAVRQAPFVMSFVSPWPRVARISSPIDVRHCIVPA